MLCSVPWTSHSTRVYCIFTSNTLRWNNVVLMSSSRLSFMKSILRRLMIMLSFRNYLVWIYYYLDNDDNSNGLFCSYKALLLNWLMKNTLRWTRNLKFIPCWNFICIINYYFYNYYDNDISYNIFIICVLKIIIEIYCVIASAIVYVVTSTNVFFFIIFCFGHWQIDLRNKLLYSKKIMRYLINAVFWNTITLISYNNIISFKITLTSANTIRC